MLRQLVPWSGNTRKRLVKSPKIYVRDSGLLHRLLGIAEFEDLLGNPVLGHSWEGFVIENICTNLSDKWQTSYCRTTEQSEIDLILEKANERWAIKIKRGLPQSCTPVFTELAKTSEQQKSGLSTVERNDFHWKMKRKRLVCGSFGDGLRGGDFIIIKT
jgi:hypothetical protein